MVKKYTIILLQILRGVVLEKFHPLLKQQIQYYSALMKGLNLGLCKGHVIKESHDFSCNLFLLRIWSFKHRISRSATYGLDASDWKRNILSGLFKIVPILAVTFATGAFWEVLFAIVRRHSISRISITCALIPLHCPQQFHSGR